MGPNVLNQDQDEILRHFIEFESQAFVEIAYNDSLGQYLTSSRGKTHEKNLGAQIWVKQVKIGPEVRFSPF